MKKSIKNKKLIAIIILCFIVSVIISFVGSMIISPKIEIEKKVITLQVGEEFNEPEYKAMAENKDVTKQVKKTGKVNPQKLGTYTLKYQIK